MSPRALHAMGHFSFMKFGFLGHIHFLENGLTGIPCSNFPWSALSLLTPLLSDFFPGLLNFPHIITITDPRVSLSLPSYLTCPSCRGLSAPLALSSTQICTQAIKFEVSPLSYRTIYVHLLTHGNSTGASNSAVQTKFISLIPIPKYFLPVQYSIIGIQLFVNEKYHFHQIPHLSVPVRHLKYQRPEVVAF